MKYIKKANGLFIRILLSGIYFLAFGFARILTALVHGEIRRDKTFWSKDIIQTPFTSPY